MANVTAKNLKVANLSDDLTLNGEPTTTTPRLVYGTAWKKDRSADLVHLAIRSGFRGVDTAAQPRHYQERLVGDGIRSAILDGVVSRSALFIQTKFTSVDGQDRNNLPYDPNVPLPEQVHASVASSLSNLATPDAEGSETYLDSLVLHSPMRSLADTVTVWQALESYVPSRIHHLGIANTDFRTLHHLSTAPEIKVRPSVVQNRFYGDTDYEIHIRAFCREHGIVFQTFWTLTGNPRLVRSQVVSTLAEKSETSREVAMYALVLALEGTTVLDGTTREAGMTGDLEGVKKLAVWAKGEGKEVWDAALPSFREIIGDN